MTLSREEIKEKILEVVRDRGHCGFEVIAEAMSRYDDVSHHTVKMSTHDLLDEGKLKLDLRWRVYIPIKLLYNAQADRIGTAVTHIQRF